MAVKNQIESVVKSMVDWGQALLIFVLGIGTVFAVLIVLWAILALMKVVFAKSSEKAAEAPKAAPKAQAPAAAPAVNGERKMSTPKKVAKAAPSNEDELVAILNGAVAAYASSTNLRVKSYKKM